jgi:hypothetical protein
LVTSRWLERIWWEITLCSYGTGILVGTGILGMNQADAVSIVCEYLRWLNDNATLFTQDAFKRMFEAFSQRAHNGELLKLGQDPGQGETVFTRRRQVLEFADALSTHEQIESYYKVAQAAL